MTRQLNLNLFRYVSRRQAYEALVNSDMVRLESMLSKPGYLMDFLFLNVAELQAMDRYEMVLAHAIDNRIDDFWGLLEDEVIGLIDLADAKKLQAAGSPLPGPGPFTIYRGMEDGPCMNRRFALAWTMSLEAACWHACPTQPYTRILSTTIDSDQILCFTNTYYQQDVIADVDDASPLEIEIEEIELLAMRHSLRYYPHLLRDEEVGQPT